MERSVPSILESVEKQIALFSELSDCLDQEEQDLRHNKFETIEGLNKTKAELSKQLETEFSAYQLMLEQLLGTEPTLDAIKASTKLQPAEKTELQNKLNQLTELSQSCQFKNEVNGRVIQINQQINTQIVNIMKGVDPNASVYDASGKIDK
jgi:flagellar biosynthesis/type III secretory pathway chaperone